MILIITISKHLFQSHSRHLRLLLLIPLVSLLRERLHSSERHLPPLLSTAIIVLLFVVIIIIITGGLLRPPKRPKPRTASDVCHNSIISQDLFRRRSANCREGGRGGLQEVPEGIYKCQQADLLQRLLLVEGRVHPHPTLRFIGPPKRGPHRCSKKGQC